MEHDEQVALIEWARMMAFQQPALELLYSTLNGAPLSKGTARRMKAEGLNSGVPDLCLPVARKGYNGLYIELKYGRNQPSERQVFWLDRLAAEGYLAVVCWGANEAIDTITEYLSNENLPAQIRQSDNDARGG